MGKIKVYSTDAIINIYKRQKKPFILEQTTLTKTIIDEAGDRLTYIATDGELKPVELGLIKSVSDYVKKNVELPVLCEKPIYIRRENKINASGDLFELDLNAAFWNFAFWEKFISEDIYKKGLSDKISKRARLVSLGALAKTKITSSFDGNEFSPPTIERSTHTEGIFFKVAQKTSELMLEMQILCGGNFLFFWCDAIFFRSGKTRDDLKRYLDENKIPFKIYRLNSVEGNNDIITVTSKEHKTEIRNFYFNKTMKKTTV